MADTRASLETPAKAHSVADIEDAKRSEAMRLNRWAPFDVHTWSDYPQVNSAINKLYQELKSDLSFSGNDAIRKKHIKVIVLDVYAKWLTHPDMYSGIYLRKAEYRAGSRYNAIHLSKLTPTVVKQLAKLEYLDLKVGSFGRDGKHGSFISRIRATPKLIELIKRHGWTEEVIQDARNRECIELRDYVPAMNKQLRIEYDDTPETIRMRKSLTAYNNLIRDAHIDVLGFPEEGIEREAVIRGRKHTWRYHLQKERKFTRRIFNNGRWDNGGRFYGPWWQQIPNSETKGAWRRRIYIMGMPTVEIDYSGLHIVLLYAQEGFDYWAIDGVDPYFLRDYDNSSDTRQLLKLLLLIAVNVKKTTPAAERKVALKAMQCEINSNPSIYQWVKDSGLDLSQVIDDFAARHAPIAHRFFTGAGNELQLIDSMMVEYVLERMTADHHPVLSIHDSFICEEPLYPVLLEHVKSAFKDVINKLFPGLETLEASLKFTAPDGEKSKAYASLFDRDPDKWHKLGMEDPKSDVAFWERFKRYDLTRWCSPHDYYVDDDIVFTVP